jgi:catechol 2,3-dioxygenase-like lactoylglutathione lyase family enzyme
MSEDSPPPELDGILETVLYYRSLEAQEVERFYRDVLGLRAVSHWPDAVAFRLPTGLLLLFDADQTLARPDPAMRHGATGVVHVPVLREITCPNGVRSFYVRDPAGNLVEIAEGDLWPR